MLISKGIPNPLFYDAPSLLGGNPMRSISYHEFVPIHKSKIFNLRSRQCMLCPAQFIISWQNPHEDTLSLVGVVNNYGEIVRSGGLIPYGYHLSLSTIDRDIY
jgi:hypothetical protein